MARRPHRSNESNPLVRLGQGDYTRDIYPPTPARHRDGRLDLGRILTREPAETYHARRGECLTSHRLAEFRSCPLLFHRKELGLIPDRDSRAFAVGRAAHTLILEGRERYEAEYAVGLLREVTPASTIRNEGCEHACDMEPEVITHATTGERFGIHRCMREECGLVRIPLDELRRWDLDLRRVAEAVRSAIGASGEVIEDVPGRVALAGTVGDTMRTVDVFVVSGMTRDDAAAVLLASDRLQVAQEPFVFTLAAMPDPTIWPGGMRPAVAVLAEHARLGPTGLAIDIEPLLALESIPHHRASTPRWLTNKDAATRLQEVVSGTTFSKAKARVYAAASRQAFRTNGQTGDGHRIETASFMDWLWKQRAADLTKADGLVEGKPEKRRLGAMASAPRARRIKDDD